MCRTVDFEAQDDGVIAKVLKEGPSAVDLSVGVPICVVVDEEDEVAAFADFKLEDEAAVEESSEEVTAAPPAVTPALSSESSLLMPGARFLSQSKGLDATVLQGSGKGGRVTKGDVLQALKDGVELPAWSASASESTSAAIPAPASVASTSAIPMAPPTSSSTISDADVTIPTITTSGAYEDVKNNSMRKVIAKRLTESKSSVPHFYASVEIELDNIMELRKKLKEMDIKVSVNDLIIRGSALALRDVPEVNASYIEGKGVTMSPTVDISVAVATPGGLITPIVPKTDELGLSGISSKVKDLATRARDGKLAPEEYQGGSFCISNLGMFGINEFSAVINPPQAAILAVGGGVKKVVVNTPYDESKSMEEQPKPGIRNVMTARLSADRRVVDEPTVGLFLSALRHYLNKPELLVL